MCVCVCVCVCVCACARMLSHFTRVQPFVTLWTVARQAPLSMGFSRQEYQSGLPCPPPGDLPHPWIQPTSPISSAWQVDSLPLSHWGSPLNLLGDSKADGQYTTFREVPES